MSHFNFNGLPQELKTRIFHIAHLADERFKERQVSLEMVPTPRVADPPGSSLNRLREYHGRSVTALSLVNKECRFLSGKWLFRSAPQTSFPQCCHIGLTRTSIQLYEHYQSRRCDLQTFDPWLEDDWRLDHDNFFRKQPSHVLGKPYFRHLLHPPSPSSIGTNSTPRLLYYSQNLWFSRFSDKSPRIQTFP